MSETVIDQAPNTSTIIVENEINSSADNQEVPTLKLKLRKPKPDKKVKWTTETVDNENMNKKKSKCCCIYQKPKKFGESSSDEEDECDHCKGHVEKRKSKNAADSEEPQQTEPN